VATWSEFTQYVRSNYKIIEEVPDRMVSMGFGLDGDRTQLVFLWRQTLMGGEEEWVQIESPIGELTPDTAIAAVKAVGNTVVGAIGSAGDVITYRHSLPLANLDSNEFERPLRLVTTTADKLEKEIFGKDEF
jgi:hypothetical protein